ncbi:MAG: protein-glutamate O-methyltransferase CheR, partial [Mariprofundaceae bacterium]|nr:protein-glutamate O-methyltransferase CheR [Mariprofundaceae bacterium]
MQASEFRYLQTFLLRQIGLSLNDDKQYLIKSRASRLLREHKLKDANALSREIRRNEHGELAKQLLDAMTTNETLFFRDQYPFEALRDMIFPELTHAKGRHGKINVWSAASSTGQEACSIAMTASESVPEPGRVQILGTDFSAKAVEYAQAGVYSQMEVQRGMPIKQLIRFFDQDGNRWSLRPELKQMMHFDHANLVENSLNTKVRKYGPFDVVFCRNVLIYFTPDERALVIDRIARCMNRGGYFISGATETPEGRLSRWKQVMFKGKR